jgi:Putative ATPase subunit of terminase (gpP-like)
MAQPPVVQLETIKTLVALHGQRKAARIAGLNANTVRSWAKRYGWASFTPKNQSRERLSQVEKLAATDLQPIAIQSPVNAVVNEIASNRTRSKLALSRYVAKTSEQAAEIPNGLAITRKAKDLADIHSTLFPEGNEQRHILNLAIVTGAFQPLEHKPDSQ